MFELLVHLQLLISAEMRDQTGYNLRDQLRYLRASWSSAGRRGPRTICTLVLKNEEDNITKAIP